jgi:osmotically-inducible protein OsmY
VEWFKNDIIVKGEMPTGVPLQTSGQQTFNQQFNGQQMNEPAGSGRRMMHHQQSFSSSSSSGNSGWQRGAINVYDPAAEITSRSSADIQGNNASGSASYQSSNDTGASANISSEPAGSNNDLTQQVYTQLRSDSSDAAQNVRVESGANGKITLRGTVNSESDKNSIESKVKSIPGVRDVDDQLEVQNK